MSSRASFCHGTRLPSITIPALRRGFLFVFVADIPIAIIIGRTAPTLLLRPPHVRCALLLASRPCRLHCSCSCCSSRSTRLASSCTRLTSLALLPRINWALDRGRPPFPTLSLLTPLPASSPVPLLSSSLLFSLLRRLHARELRGACHQLQHLLRVPYFGSCLFDLSFSTTLPQKPVFLSFPRDFCLSKAHRFPPPPSPLHNTRFFSTLCVPGPSLLRPSTYSSFAKNLFSPSLNSVGFSLPNPLSCCEAPIFAQHRRLTVLFVFASAVSERSCSSSQPISTFNLSLCSNGKPLIAKPTEATTRSPTRPITRGHFEILR